MRFPVPNTVSQQILDTHGYDYWVTMSNPSAVAVNVSEDQSGMDNTQTGNVPPIGHVVPGPTTPFFFGVVNGKLFARSTAPGGAIEISSWRKCGP